MAAAPATAPVMDDLVVISSQSNQVLANAVDIQFDNQNKPYILLDAVLPNLLMLDHPTNAHHLQVFLETGENVGVINNDDALDRLLPKFAGGTPSHDNLDAATGFRVLGRNSLKAHLLNATTGQHWKWAGGAWKLDTSA